MISPSQHLKYVSDPNPSVSEPPLQALSQPSVPSAAPLTVDYVRLVRFLVGPFLDSPELLRVDCEVSPRTLRVLIRLAFEGDDKGRVFGRGGRNVQAVRTVVQSVAQAAGHSAYLEVFGSQAGGQAGGQHTEQPAAERSARPAPRRPQPRVNP